MTREKSLIDSASWPSSLLMLWYLGSQSTDGPAATFPSWPRLTIPMAKAVASTTLNIRIFTLLRHILMYISLVIQSLYVTTCVKKCPVEKDEIIECKPNSVVKSCTPFNSADNTKAIQIYDTTPGTFLFISQSPWNNLHANFIKNLAVNNLRPRYPRRLTKISNLIPHLAHNPYFPTVGRPLGHHIRLHDASHSWFLHLPSPDIKYLVTYWTWTLPDTFPDEWVCRNG